MNRTHDCLADLTTLTHKDLEELSFINDGGTKIEISKRELRNLKAIVSHHLCAFSREGEP
jgi:hypothetical protein